MKTYINDIQIEITIVMSTIPISMKAGEFDFPITSERYLQRVSVIVEVLPAQALWRGCLPRLYGGMPPYARHGWWAARP